MMDLHALLIGIDAYDGGGSLNGCVNDVDAIQRILLDRIGMPKERIKRLVSPRTGTTHETTITDELPTLANIRIHLDRLAGDDVASSDRILIFYSGHGTQLTLQDAEGNRFPREALLPKDKITVLENRYLTDWELNAALARICARCHSATVILDCCSSAGATRALEDEDTGTARYWPTPEIVPVAEVISSVLGARGVAENLLEFAEKCQVIAACRADERAKEAEDEGTTMGYLTRALCNRLSTFADGDLSDLRWGRIWRQVDAEVVQRNAYQHPWISDSFGRRVFGGDTGIVSDTGFGIVEKDGVYEIDAGTLVDVTNGAVVGVYGDKPDFFPELGTEADRAARVGDLRVVDADLATSRAVALGTWELPDAPRGRLVQSGENATLSVAIRPPTSTLSKELEASPFVQVVDAEKNADIVLAEVDDGWALLDDIHGLGEDEPQFPTIPSVPDAARAMVDHYYRYSAPLRLARSCRDLPRMLQVALLDCNGVELTPENAQTIKLSDLSYSDHASFETADGDRICISVANHSDLDLHVTLIDVAASGRVLLLGRQEVPKRARMRFWYEEAIGQPFPVSVPVGQRLGVDRLVAIGATNPKFDLGHLASHKTFRGILLGVACGGADKDIGGLRGTPPVEQYTSTVVTLRTIKEDLKKGE